MSWNLEKLTHDIEKKIALVERRRCKLVLVVGLPFTGKTKLLRKLTKTNPERYTYINLNLELSALLKEVTEKERPFRVQEFLRKLVSDKQGVLLIDNTEILFDPELKLDPVKSLEELSRINSVASVWRGSVKDGFLSYAEPGHREYFRGPIGEFEIVEVTDKS